MIIKGDYPMKKALLIIDYVNDFVADEGKLTCGTPAQVIDEHITNQISLFQKNENFIVIATDSHDKDDLYNKERAMFPAHCYEEQGQALYGNVGKAINDIPSSLLVEINKTRYSAFCGTALDLKLKERNVSEIHLTGVCTDICILHTAIDAYNLGYQIVVHKNCVASFHEAGHTYSLDHFKNVLGATIL